MALSPGHALQDGDNVNMSTATQAPIIFTPLTGTTITLSFLQRTILISPAGTIAALTIKLPTVTNNGAIVIIGFTQVVTALTVQDVNGAAVQSTAGAIGVAVEYRFVNPTVGWIRWR